MGALPRPLVELIVGNGSWLQNAEVRRALLANPRLGTDQILRVLRVLPKHELKLVPAQTAYPTAVRDAARRMLRSSTRRGLRTTTIGIGARRAPPAAPPAAR